VGQKYHPTTAKIMKYDISNKSIGGIA